MKFSVSALLFPLLLLLLLPHVTCSVLHGNDTDRMALLDFKLSCSDPRGTLASWNVSRHFCSWKGVLCSQKHPQRVMQLDLSDQGLIGHISPSLGNLTYLRALRLSNNSFTGEIPTSFGQLHRLQVISMSNNSLQGWIPEELCNCSNLQILSLYSNQLKGRIPRRIGSLIKLIILNLSANNLTGSIPHSIGNMTALNVISLSKNYLNGSIPEELGMLTGMSTLSLGLNSLSGRVPVTLFNNMSSLLTLGLELNHLDKAVLPSDFGSHLPNLLHLGLDSNQFEGPIPASLANASRLTDIGLSSNNFNGKVPNYLGNLHHLTFLDLESNHLETSDRESWKFIDSLANCSQLQTMSLSINNLRGTVPNSIGNLSSELQILYLGTNQLSGMFPPSIANLRSLIALSLENNQYNGAIPEWIGNLKNLQVLYLEGNSFDGPIPYSIGNLSQLSYLYLQDNKIDGILPSSLGKMTSLLRLNITNNSLQGSVPAEIFSLPSLISCELSFNKRDGTLPPEVGSAKQLVELRLSSNELSGEIPHTLGDCHGLNTIELAHNSLYGEIPVSLDHLESLKGMNFSHNNLSGTIPKSLANLQLLDQMDLSYNHLIGEVPKRGVFLNASALVLEGNSGLCGGISELHIPACPVATSDSMQRRLSIRVKIIVSVAIIVISLLVTIIVLIFLLRRNKQKEVSTTLPLFTKTFLKVTYRDIAEATEGFSESNLIGWGKYGSVYKARLHAESDFVAIKVFNMETRGANKSFMAECEALRSLRHRNLVPILTACSSIDSEGNDFKALVYEFMPNGSLDSLLYPKEDTTHISRCSSLAQRLTIACDIANALEYLHHSSQRPIVHADLKPSNILLDIDMTARISDFGLARFLDNVNTTSTVAVKGTVGYIAPEYASGGQVMTPGDVYSFGVILLEMFIGRRPTDDMFKDGLNIVSFVEASLTDHILEIIDAHIKEAIDDFGDPNESMVTVVDCVKSVLRIGLSCTRRLPNERINMIEVAQKLQALRESYMGDEA